METHRIVCITMHTPLNALTFIQKITCMYLLGRIVISQIEYQIFFLKKSPGKNNFLIFWFDSRDALTD